MTRLGRFTSVAAIVGLIFVAGCGVPVDKDPTALSKAGVPFHLLAPARTSPSTTSPAPARLVQTSVFLIAPTGKLAAAARAVDATNPALSTLTTLTQGPTPSEAAAGVQTAIPPQTTILGASADSAGLATIDVGGTFGQLVGTAQIQAVAQFVFTATTFSAANWKVENVTFQLNGRPVEVPTDSGAQAPVVNESDFSSLAPLPASSS